jgi:glycosyltransferase involved in cell wall biosynthesis
MPGQQVHGGLRVGVDGACWSNRRGYGRYARSLLAALARRGDGDRYVLFVDPETARASLPAGLERVVVPTRRPPAAAASASGRRDLLDLGRMAWGVARHRLDVFFFPSVYTYFPLLRPVPAVVAVHDVIAEHHPRLVFARRDLAFFWKAKVALALCQARLILTVSEHARVAILEQFRLRPDRVRVVLEAPDPVFRPLPGAREPAVLVPGLPVPPGARFLLYVGGLSPHKNLPVLIEAYRQLIGDADLADVRLLLVGDHAGDVFYSAYDELRALLSRHGLEDRVSFTGYLPDDVLVELYNRAELLVLPSLEEGFGLPAVEAAACGTAVAVSAAGPAGRLLGEGAWTFSPRDVAGLADGLRTLMRDPGRRQAMGAAGQRRVASLTWDRAATEVHGILREVARR